MESFAHRQDVGITREKMQETLGAWQRRLLQLDRSNRLLYFKPGRTSVRIVDKSPNSIINLLRESKNGLAFDYAERASRPDRNRAGNSGDNQFAEEPTVIAGDLKTDTPVIELQRKLGNLRRKDREWEQEQGLNVLYLAIGFLEWTDEDSESVQSPLLLLPCDLERESPRDAFRLFEDDDDLTINSTLAVKLEEFGIKLPEPESDEDEPGGYLNKVYEAVRNRPGWRVNQHIFLTTLAYSKLAMWRDIEALKEAGTDHRVILTLVGGKAPDISSSGASESLSLNPEELANGRLDDVLDVKDHFTVLPADYSQLIAIAAARSGKDLVIHGPPGTGKSQTIANVIATFLAESKTVLFVSEKTAALDVVKRRLDEKNLGMFCLDLHSERGKKSSVYQQLQHSIDDPRLVHKPNFDYDLLLKYRKKLNGVVRALHQVREPLARTVFQVHGQFAARQNAPHAGFEIRNIDTLDHGRLIQILSVANRIRLMPREFGEHWNSHWRILITGSPSLELANTIREDMENVGSAVGKLQTDAVSPAEALGIMVPRSLQEMTILERLLEQFKNAPAVPQNWLRAGVTHRLKSLSRRWAQAKDVRASQIKQLTEAFGEPVPNWDYPNVNKNLIVARPEEEAIRHLLGDEWSERIIKRGLTTSKVISGLKDHLTRLKTDCGKVAAFLGVEVGENWDDISRLSNIVKAIGNVGPVPQSWIKPGGFASVTNLIDRAEVSSQSLVDAQTQLFSELEPEFVDAVDQAMLVRYRTGHQSRLKRLFSSSFRSDQRTVQAFRLKPGRYSLEDGLRSVERALGVQHFQSQWDQAAAQLESAIPDGCTGLETDWESLRQRINTVEEVCNNWNWSPSLLNFGMTSEDTSKRCKDISPELERSLLKIEDTIVNWLGNELHDDLKQGKSTLYSLREKIEGVSPTVERIETALIEPINVSRIPIANIASVIQLVDIGARLQALEREHSQVDQDLRADFGDRYKGFDTDWDDVGLALDWVANILEMIPSKDLSPKLIRHTEIPNEPSEYEDIRNSVSAMVQEYKNELESIARQYDLDSGPWEDWSNANFEEIVSWSEELSADAEGASGWLSYKDVVKELGSVLTDDTVDLIRSQTDDSEMVVQIIERRILGAWLDWIYTIDPRLGAFAAAEQGDLIDKFKELDQALPLASENAVRRNVFANYPDIYATSTRASEIGILRSQLSRKRGQLPIRRLLRRIPHLIQSLKPCFLVSPLAVSQYLPLSNVASEMVNFDVVIFDEASQVFPEDAVPAIVRGRQLILAGDQMQLPPSNFFRSSLSSDDEDLDDESEDEPENQLLGRESILDVGVGLTGTLFREAYLDVHFRSRHESLIRFSNHYFYKDRLLTFPSLNINDPWKGVHDIYVPDGRYDAGASRTNRVEAERVVDLVFEHMRTRPNSETLGVVALSRPQADLIEQLIDNRRILERDAEDRFDERSDEPFFVKNLENVQGDERDHMIISIGYGPTVESGAVPNRFGPINSPGGERRLNVVVTRARERIDFVHSLRASDIHTQQDGARLLRRYIEYASNPRLAFEGEVTIDTAAEPESEFEAAVEQSLLAKGYRVARQVSVAGYRIDLTILSDDGESCDLGIECDGKAYHSAPAARDRDWLRQSVLEGLGWRIHRVWSTAWCRNPEGEIQRIESALELARVREANDRVDIPKVSGESKGQDSLTEQKTSNKDLTMEVAPSDIASIELEEYTYAKLQARPKWADLRVEPTSILLHLVTQVADTEGPVHVAAVFERIRQLYGMGRLGSASRERLEHAVDLANRQGMIFSEGEFIWASEGQLARPPRRPADGNIEHVPSSELTATVLLAAKLVFGAPKEDLIVETARQLGFSRTGGKIHELVSDVIERLLRQGLLNESLGMIRVRD